MNLVFFRTPKPKKFNYIPRYYDPEKEEWERRKKELGLLGKGDAHERLRAEMRRKWRVEGSQRAGRASTLRVFVYLFILIISVYLFFFTDLIKKLMLVFSGR